MVLFEALSQDAQTLFLWADGNRMFNSRFSFYQDEAMRYAILPSFDRLTIALAELVRTNYLEFDDDSRYRITKEHTPAEVPTPGRE